MMIIEIKQDQLISALNKVHSIVERRTVNEILEHVKIEIIDGIATFTCTDMEIVISASIPLISALEKNVSFTTSVIVLHEIIKRLPNSTLIMIDISDISDKNESIGNFLKLQTSLGDKFTLPCLKVSDFPAFDPVIEKITPIKILAKNFKKILSSTKHAIALTESIKFYLEGVFLSVCSFSELPYQSIKLSEEIFNNFDNSKETDEPYRKENFIIGVATDGYRISTNASPLSSTTQESEELLPPEIIIHRKTCTEILRLLEFLDLEQEIQLGISDRRIVFSIGNVTLVSKLIKSTFPKYKKVLEKSYNTMVLTSKKAISNAVDIVRTVIDKKVKPIKIKFQTNGITLSVIRKKQISAERSIECSSINLVNEIEIIIDSRYILDALNAIEKDEIMILIDNGDKMPIIIRDKCDQNAIHIISPMSQTEEE